MIPSFSQGLTMRLSFLTRPPRCCLIFHSLSRERSELAGRARAPFFSGYVHVCKTRKIILPRLKCQNNQAYFNLSYLLMMISAVNFEFIQGTNSFRSLCPCACGRGRTSECCCGFSLIYLRPHEHKFACGRARSAQRFQVSRQEEDCALKIISHYANSPKDISYYNVSLLESDLIFCVCSFYQPSASASDESMTQKLIILDRNVKFCLINHVQHEFRLLLYYVGESFALPTYYFLTNFAVYLGELSAFRGAYPV